jgi:hypothetical protein
MAMLGSYHTCRFFQGPLLPACLERAVRHLYAGLDSCWSYSQQAVQHWDISQVGQPMTLGKAAALKRFLELADRYFDLEFTEATFAGAILQTAYVAMRLCSRNNSIPSSSAEFVRPTPAMSFSPWYRSP